MPQAEHGTFLLSSEIRRKMMDLLLSAEAVMKDDPDRAHSYLDGIAEFLCPTLSIEVIS